MRLKNILIIGVSVITIGGAIYFGLPIHRGIKPAIIPAAEDIAENTEQNLGLKLLAGFKIEIFAKNLPGARVMVYDPGGKIIVGLTSEGKIVSLPDGRVLLEGLNRPHGLAVKCYAMPYECQLYVAEENKVSVYDYPYDEAANIYRLKNGHKIIGLPSGDGHFTRTIMFMPYPRENDLLISVGSSCNVCIESDERRAKILVYNIETRELKEFARGLRNAVFMAIHPVSGEIWATEMGRDELGDDLPPDEIDIIKEGKNYGWPICYGKNIHDSAFDQSVYIRNPCMEPFEVPSHIDIPAHSAPLGLAFIPEEGWPKDYWYNLVVAYHGSWNRSVPTGYKLVRIKLDASGKYLGTGDFITGWLKSDGSAVGRPVDILVEPGGTMYISDDKAGVIYKIIKM